MTNQKMGSSPQPKSNSFLNGCLLFCIIVFLLLIVGWGSLIGAASFLNVGGRVKPVDAIVVLSGDDGDRILEAVKWYNKNYGNYFVITKTHTEDIGEGQTYSEKLMRLAMEGGIPADSILFTEGEASSTVEEAKAIKQLAQQRNIESILVITAPYHTRRTTIIFDREFADVDIKVLVHPVEDSWYKPLTWYLSSEGWRQTIAEYGSLFLIWANR